MLLGVELPGLLGMLGGKEVMTMREMRMLRRLLMVLLAMVMGGIAVMLGRCLEMIRGLFVMLGQFGCVRYAISGLTGGAPAGGSDISAVTVLRLL